MLPRRFKLTSLEIKQILRQGKLVSLTDVEMRYLPSPGQSKFAVIVPLRVDKRSVVRHKIKRLFHEALFTLLPILSAPISGVLKVKYCPRESSQSHIFRQTKSLLEKAGLLPESRP